uniref:Tumor necrosis factor receptor superfamily, member 1B n=1 Tax=Oncorhynchus mykiss TaxID=8022 RepID=A0A8K9WVU9_ONCMY
MLLIIPPPDQVHFMVPLSLQVYTLPYTPDSDGSCRNKTAEYYNPDVNLCCSKCTSAFDSFMREDKGLKYVQKCSSTTKTQCACQTGMYCILDQHPDCKECSSYTYCKPGHGVSVEGTAESDVECASLTHAFMHNTNACKHAHTQTRTHTAIIWTVSIGVNKGTVTLSPQLCVSGEGRVDLWIGKYRQLYSPPVRDHSRGLNISPPSSLVYLHRFVVPPLLYLSCLLGKGDCSNVGQAETQQDAVKTWSGSGCSNSLEGLSICPVQSTLPQPSILASTPQPSPQSTSPLASVPLVNVNITVTYPVNIGNELCSRPTSTQIDSPQADPETPLSREEEVYVNMPQRESCKEALTQVQEFGNDV